MRSSAGDECGRGKGHIGVVKERVQGGVQRWSQASLWAVDEEGRGVNGDPEQAGEKRPGTCVLPGTVKVCPKCGKPKEAVVTREIRHDRGGEVRMRTRWICRPCHNAHVKAQRRAKATPEQVAGMERREALIAREKLLTPEERRRNQRRRNTENKRKRQLEAKGWTRDYLWRYGLTQEAYIELLEKQDYKCPLCGKPHRYQEWAEKKPAKGIHNHSGDGHVTNYLLVVDHDHVTGEVRGLLCSDCNILEGLVKKALARGVNLQHLVDYTQQYERRKNGGVAA